MSKSKEITGIVIYLDKQKKGRHIIRPTKEFFMHGDKNWHQLVLHVTKGNYWRYDFI